MLFASNLPVFRYGIETGVAQVLLKQAQRVSRVIKLHCMHAEGVSETIRANASYPARFGIHQIRKSGSSGAVSHNLPSSMPVQTED